MRILISYCNHYTNFIIIRNTENFSGFFSVKTAHFMHN